jgi:Zn-dependent peptidase ImmA (M78 family)/DNA-binding XRE family transcriptional regulator
MTNLRLWLLNNKNTILLSIIRITYKTTDMSHVFADRFKAARIMSGLSLQDLADKLGNRISKQALHKYEKGEVIPDSEMIGLLSEALNVRPDFFFRELKVELGEVEFRKLNKFSAKEENRIIEHIKDYLSRYLELEEIIGISTEFKNPLEGWPEINDFNGVESAAKEVRKKWRLGIDPIFNAMELLEDNHIKVIEIEAKDGLDGMQTKVNGNIPVIVINTSRVKKDDRKRFTMMHELGHLLLPITHLPEKQKEILCHQFAAAILFPEDAAKGELGESRNKLMIQELGGLKKQYGISIQALIMRAKDLQIISPSYCSQLFFMINQMGWKVDEPVDYVGVEKSNRFDQLLYRALGEELISMSKAAALKNLKLSEFKSQSLVM